MKNTWGFVVCILTILVGGCGAPPRQMPLGEQAQLSRQELLFLASEAAAQDRLGDPEDKMGHTVEEILAVRGREDLVFVVIQEAWFQGHALLVDRGTGHVLQEFYPGQYCSVSAFETDSHTAGTLLRISYSTGRGNYAGCDELVVGPDDSILWLAQVCP